jgi:hypothetical protein
VPLRHVVLIELKPDTPTETVDELVTALRALPPQIPAIRTYEVTRDIGLAEGNATVAVVAGFDDADGWRTYGPHPAHQEVVQRLVTPNAVRRTAVQGEVPAL